MLKKTVNDSENNFWISYADLMAGLLFVFILLIGAIVTKYIITKSNVAELKRDLKDEQSELDRIQSDLNSSQKLLVMKDMQIANLNKIIIAKDKSLENLESSFTNKILSLEELLKEANKIISSKESELLIQRDKQSESLQKIISLNSLVDEINKIVTTKDEELSTLIDSLKNQELKHERLVADLNSMRSRIKNLTGMKIKVISALKRALGKKMEIDPKSGSIRVSANILFEQGKADLKESAKVELKEIFSEYIRALIENDSIREHLDKIVIEGHTNSDGSYLYNLNLSQKRAYSVMQYLLSLDFAKKYDIKKIVMASGRSDLDLIFNEDGDEDKNSSRRIEIKFLLKNESAMKEIEKILEDG